MQDNITNMGELCQDHVGERVNISLAEDSYGNCLIKDACFAYIHVKTDYIESIYLNPFHIHSVQFLGKAEADA